MFDKKKRKWFKIRTNEGRSIRNKSKVIFSIRITINIIHLKNISQVSSFTDKEREKLIIVQLVIIL